ncbi:MAG: hypothetical protein KatS3mg087_2037 [Patescibacteria group bacterium]|nr:MAG: hypothetical protein KatS3mg087_2037 [Patescibacteria group bacterium]
MQTDQFTTIPFSSSQARDHVIVESEEYHGHKSISAEMSMADSIMCKMSYFTKVFERFDGALETHCCVSYGSEDGKSKGWAVFQAVEVTNHCHVMIDSDSDNGNEHHHTADSAGCSEPCWDRTADKMMYTGPGVEECQSPEPCDTEIIAMNRTA